MRWLAGAVAMAAAAMAGAQTSAPVPPQLAAAVAAKTRTPANIERDKYRHPAETLAFFGVKPTDTVVEVSPGGGWYTEILAPYLAARGRLYAAAGLGRALDGVRALQEKSPATYGKVQLVGFPAKAGDEAVPAGSASVVLTFRNVHNWRMDSPAKAEAAFADMYRMLRPGGTLGVVEHRLPEARDAAAEEKSGYLKESTVVALAEKAGFKLAGKSEINANPKDTADWPKGVWTLPPTYELGDVDRAKYQAIGESDRMTLKFVKPR